MNEFEAVGEAITGAALARAVEPAASGTGTAGAAAAASCLNCGTALAGSYCHACGQKAQLHRHVRGFIHEIAHGVLHFDGKIWRTLPLLASRPGELTRRYIDGERARFVSPLALFLFSVFLLFALFSATGSSLGGGGQEARVSVARAEQKLKQLDATRRDLAARGLPTRTIDQQLIEARTERRLMTIGSANPGEPVIEGKIDTGWTWLDQRMEQANRNPALLIYKVQTNAYKFSWTLIPISVPFVWLLFLHRRRYRRDYPAYDHVVFVTYSIAFMSLVAFTVMLLGALDVVMGPLVMASFLLLPWHLYRQLRGTYALSRRSALWRTAMLLAFALMVMGLFIVALFAIGAAAY